MTNDADVTVTLNTLDAFEKLKDNLAPSGCVRTAGPHRMQHSSRGRCPASDFVVATVVARE